MKTYIKPYTYCTLLTEESHILAGSNNPASTKPTARELVSSQVVVHQNIQVVMITTITSQRCLSTTSHGLHGTTSTSKPSTSQ